MRRAFRLFPWISIACTAACLAEPPGKAVGVKISAAERLGANRQALIIGINEYADARVPKLKFAEADAKALRDTLTDPQVGGFATEHVTMLLGKEATARNVRKALYELRKAGPDELVVIFFSGHGAKQGGESFWVTQDAELGDLGPTALPNAELARLLAAIPSQRVVTLLDCCYAADTVLNQKSIVNIDDVARSFSGKGRVTIAGAGGGEEAIEVAGLRRGVFTHFIVDGLRGGADANRDGVVTLVELWAYLESNVERVARQNRGVQKPTMHMETGQQTDRFLLSLNPAAAADAQAALGQLRALFEDDKITAAQFEEGKALLSHVTADAEAKRRRDVYADLAAGRLDPKYLGAALTPTRTDDLRPSPVRPEPSRPPGPARPMEEGSGNTEPSKELTLDLGGGAKLECVLIPAGEFLMGSPDSEANHQYESPEHQVQIAKPFYMGKFEVTNGQYRRYKSEHDSKDFLGVSLNGDNQPVVDVSWEDARGFCEWLSNRTGKTVRLPSEAEWEYAARCGDGRVFPWGNNWPPPSGSGNYEDEAAKAKFGESYKPIEGYRDGYAGSAPVGSFKSNRWGLYDMGGNVGEWCEDWYHVNYEGSPSDGRAWLTGGEQKYRILRGGYFCTNALRWYLRCASREASGPGERYTFAGFRVVAMWSGTSP